MVYAGLTDPKEEPHGTGANAHHYGHGDLLDSRAFRIGAYVAAALLMLTAWGARAYRINEFCKEYAWMNKLSAVDRQDYIRELFERQHSADEATTENRASFDKSFNSTLKRCK